MPYSITLLFCCFEGEGEEMESGAGTAPSAGACIPEWQQQSQGKRDNRACAFAALSGLCHHLSLSRWKKRRRRWTRPDTVTGQHPRAKSELEKTKGWKASHTSTALCKLTKMSPHRGPMVKDSTCMCGKRYNYRRRQCYANDL